MKKFISAAALGIAVAGVFAVASCGKEKETTTTATATETPTTTVAPTTTEVEKYAAKYLKNYIFESEGQAVSADLSLPATLTYKKETYPMTWTSDNAAVAISAEATDGKYTGTVVRPATERATVNLTATLKVADDDTASVTFTVYVNPYDVYEIADAFTFEYNKGTAFKSFEVPTSYTYADGVEATISWAVVGDDQPISVSEDGKTINVVQQEKKTAVRLAATFTYNGTTVTKNYDFSVYKERTAEELLHAFYDDVGSETFTIRGYVVAKAGYVASYGDGYLYVEDQSLKGGYYIYYAYIDQAGWDSLQPGTRVEIPGCMSTNYNGLIETTNSKDKQVSIITDDSVLAPLTDEQLKIVTEGVAIDNAFYANDDDLKYQTGSRVTLTSWQVKEVTQITATAGGTALTLVKGDKEIQVKVSKYGVDLATDSTNPTTADKTVAALNACKVGDYVNVSGLLNNYKGWYILACDENVVTVTTDDNGASIYEAQSPSEALKSVTLDTAYVEATEIDLSAAFLEGVEITVDLGTATTAVYNAETKKITITPVAGDTTGENVTITLTAKNGKYTATKTVTTVVRDMNDADMLAYENEHFALDVTEPGEYELSATGQTYSKVAAAYAVTEGADYAEIKDGKLVVKSVDGDTTVKVKVTLSIGEETPVEKELTLTIKNPDVIVQEPMTALEADTAYAFVIDKDGTKYYSTAAVASKYYLGLTTDATKGYDKIYAVVTDAGYKLYFKTSDTTNTYLTGVVSSGKGTVGTTTDETAATVFSLIDGMPGLTVSGTDWVLMSQGTYANVGLYKASTASSNYPVMFTTPETYNYTRAQKVEYETINLSVIGSISAYESTKVELNVTPEIFKDVTITYSLAEGETNATLDGNVLSFNGVDADVNVVVTATIECNGVQQTYPLTYAVKDVASYMTVSEVIAAATANTIKSGDMIAITGVAYYSGGNLWITDGTNDFEVYKPLSTGAVALTDIKDGDVISLVGEYTKYNTTYETNGSTAQILVKAAATDDQKLAVTKGELALDATLENDKTYTLATAGTIFKDVTITWSLGSDSYTTAALNGNTLTITQGSADETVTVNATLHLEGNEDVVVPFTIAVSANAATKTATLSFAGGDGSYVTADATVSSTFWSVDAIAATIQKNECSNSSGCARYNSGGYIQLYGSASLTLTAATGYTIDKIVITYGSTANAYTLNGNAATKDTTEFTIGGSSVVIKAGSAQLQIKSIAITYTKAE